MQDSTYAVQDVCMTGRMQDMPYEGQDRWLLLKGSLSLSVGVWPLTSSCLQQPACKIDTLRMWKGGEGVADPSNTQFQNSLIKVNYILLKIDLDNGK